MATALLRIAKVGAGTTGGSWPAVRRARARCRTAFRVPSEARRLLAREHDTEFMTAAHCRCEFVLSNVLYTPNPEWNRHGQGRDHGGGVDARRGEQTVRRFSGRARPELPGREGLVALEDDPRDARLVAFADREGHVDAAIHRRHQAMDRSEAEAGSARAAVTRCFQPGERLHHPRNVIFGDARPVVGNAQDRRIAFAHQRNARPCAITQGVGHQIAQGAAQPARGRATSSSALILRKS